MSAVNVPEELAPLPADSPFFPLSTAIRGRVVLQSDADYAHLLRDGTFNLAQDARPLALVLAAGTADVAATVKFVRERGLELTVSGGRHTLKGMKTGAVCLDLRVMRGVVIDRERGLVHVQGGAKLGDLDGETGTWGLAAVAGSDPRTGVGGYLCGGGYGWLSRHYGMAADNMVEAEIVLADGRVVVCSESSEPDLFFALRGAGMSFGVVTRFTLKLYPHPVLIHARMQLYPITQLRASLELLRNHLESKAFGPSGRREVSTMWEANWTYPKLDRNGWSERRPFVQLLPTYIAVDAKKAADEHAQEAQLVLKEVTDGLPVKPFLSAPNPIITYLDLQSIMKPHIPPSHRTEVAFFIPALPDDLISALCESFDRAPYPGAAMIAFPVGGAIADHSPGETAFPWRLKRGFWFLILASTFDYPDDRARVLREREALAKWVAATGELVRKWAVGSFVNRIGSGARNEGGGEDEAGYDAAMNFFGANTQRLVALKKRYDPAGLFSNSDSGALLQAQKGARADDLTAYSSEVEKAKI
ncbi:hypothetical protein DFJ74DRAFT_377512 [Hyaloraphidium curvatum]|nr:hypothetical protein DFJ74DRAFT_377512 [Hyaloraphidium curvatum]